MLVEETTDELKVREKNDKLKKPFDWTRVKSDMYKGDLRQFIDLSSAGNSCEIRVIPRIDIRGESDGEANCITLLDVGNVVECHRNCSTRRKYTDLLVHLMK